MKFVIDMNLGARWVAKLESAGHQVVHWSAIGAPDAADETIMAWARDNQHVVLTSDLGFGGRLVRAGEYGPSVVQLRNAVTLADVAADAVVHAIRANEDALSQGAIVTVEPVGCRVRKLFDSNPE